MVKERIWRATFSELFDLLESFDWPIQSADCFRDLDACRLVVNIHKHGDGPSLKEVSNSFPAYLDCPITIERGSLASLAFLPNHEHLKVTDKDLKIFSNAILQFWEAVPENVFQDQILDTPSWLMKAFERDQIAFEQKEKR